MPQNLEDLTVNEVSLVDRPANAEKGVARARVALYKRDNSKPADAGIVGAVQNNEQQEGVTTNMPMTLEQLEKRFNELEPQVAALTAENKVLKTETDLVLKMSPTDRALYAELNGDHRTTFINGDDSVRKSLLEKAANTKKEKEALASMDEATAKRFQDAGPTEREILLAKAFEAMDLAAHKAAKVTKINKAAADPEEMEPDGDEGVAVDDKNTDEVKCNMAKMQDQINKQDVELTTIRKAARLNVFISKAETELPHTAGSAVEKGEMLMSLADSLPGGEEGQPFQKVFAQLKAADGAMKGQFQEVGKAGGAIPALRAWDAQVEAVAKRDNISVSKATEKVMDEQPELYLEYEKSQRQRVQNY